MVMCKKIGFILLWLCAFSLFAQSKYLIIEAPVGAQPSSKILWIKWAGASRGLEYTAPDSGTIYYDRKPGGGYLPNYRYTIKNAWVDTLTKKKQDNILGTSGTVKCRSTAFVAADQPDMGFGVFYCVVALPFKNVLGKSDTLISNEFLLMIETPKAVDWIGPRDTIPDLTPTFKWNANAGVPYYHIILSDDVIKVDTNNGGNVDLKGLSVIWQAITPNTQMVYGAPDPSKTITADPPPLSPGKRYTWIVLNNYGNHPAFSSSKVKLPQGEFVIRGKALAKPVAVFPKDTILNSDINKKITFKWTNLDKDANTYKIYAYVGTDFSGVYDGISAQLIVWQTEVSASTTKDTMSVEIDAASTLTSNKYVWNVIAVDSKGAGSSGDTAGFHYHAPTGTLKIYTRELIKVPKGDSFVAIVNPVGLAEIKVEVLDGSMEAPLLFYTDQSGNLSRSRPTGAYRITAIKSEFESQTKTIALKDGETLENTFYLERPEATVFGNIVDEAGIGINLASVYGISDLNDTVLTKTDAAGNFILKCSASDWRIWSEMVGYKSVLSRKVTVGAAQNLDFGTITMQKNPYTLSGVIKNSTGEPLLGVRVQLLQNGKLISEIPSTPQTGAFSFSIPSGSYNIIAEKTGFSSYNSSLDILSSNNISITMQPGATVISGYVYGKTWINSRNSYVFAPITNAKLKFVKAGSTDTTIVIPNSTYGDFKISLPGALKYLVYSSANGYAPKTEPCTLTTIIRATMNYYDTLNAYATVNGTVQLSSNKNPIGGSNVNIIRIADRTVAASSKTSSDGTFEIRNIDDGVYLMSAGKDGYVLDSIQGDDTLKVINGKPDKSTIAFFIKGGDKTIKWHAAHNGAIKIQSPFIKTLSLGDSIIHAGAGSYVLSYDVYSDSLSDSIIVCSYHSFTVADSEVTHIDTVPLLLTHKSPASITPENGNVQLSLYSETSLDSVMVYYRDITVPSFSVLKKYEKSNLKYSFNIPLQRDGSTMLYYFKGYKGTNIYGDEKETYHVFVNPDTSRLSKFEIVPSSKDTLIMPSSCNVNFTFKGYYSSAFLPDTVINGKSLQWTLTNAQGCSVTKNNGVSVTVRTGSINTSTTPVTLTVMVDTAITKIIKGYSPVYSVVFRVSGTTLKSIKVRRTDPGSPNPITTSAIDRAEFTADGYDNNGKLLQISPNWKIIPVTAGTISIDGIFKPSRKFIGNVRIFAETNGIIGEYAGEDKNSPGMPVLFVINKKNIADTAMNGNGCTVIFPPNIISDNDIGILELKKKTLENEIERRTGKYNVVLSDAYDIKQLQNISLNTTKDSIQLLIDLPDEQKSSGDKLYIGNWNEDSLQWKILANSIVTNSAVSAKLAHFSEYTILVESGKTGYLKVSPNAFSPYVNQGQVNPLHPYNGACIQFKLQTEKPINAKLKIYNAVGDLVWSMSIGKAKSRPYAIWWDGRTSEREMILENRDEVTGSNGEIVVAPRGNKMCRNGRYFIVLTGTEDIDHKTYRFMKPVVLMK